MDNHHLKIIAMRLLYFLLGALAASTIILMCLTSNQSSSEIIIENIDNVDKREPATEELPDPQTERESNIDTPPLSNTTNPRPYILPIGEIYSYSVNNEDDVLLLTIETSLPHGCAELQEPIVAFEDNVFDVSLTYHRDPHPGMMCIQAEIPTTTDVQLYAGILPSSEYGLIINGQSYGTFIHTNN